MASLYCGASAPDDLPDAVELRFRMTLEIDHTDRDQKYPGWRERFIAFYAERIRSNRAAVFVAKRGSRTVGMCCIFLLINARSEIEREQSAYVTSVYVLPEWRNRGIATKLVAMAIDWAKDRGCPMIRLRTTKLSKPLYERLGFRNSGELELRWD